MNQSRSLVRCASIRKRFPVPRAGNPDLEVLRGISFELAAGEVVAIIGASGSGKSTLLHILGGLDAPSEGEVWWDEQSILRMPEESRSRLRGKHIGFVFQFHHLLPEFSALENVMMPLLIQGAAPAAARKRAEELLRRVDLDRRADHRPAELSGGEQQRVAVARALANRPPVVFADEPSGNLDSESSQRLHELLFTLNREDGQAFVIVTHNESFAASAHRTFAMRDGLLHPVPTA
jgi:lipoprotein-releasing system ATP-binding protein